MGVVSMIRGALRREEKAFSVPNYGLGSGWWPLIREPTAGAWQRNMEVKTETALAFSAVRTCVSLISSDIAKMRVKLVERDPETGIWTEIKNRSDPRAAVLRKPNHYQTRIQFFETWLISKLSHGYTYVLKGRDGRNVVTRMYVLDPVSTRPLIADDGSVFYQVKKDTLAGQKFDVIIPASEIIHDILDPLFHPLCGVSPIVSCAAAVLTGTAIQGNSSSFFANNSTPSGILTAPGFINDATAARLKEQWDSNYSGSNSGKVAVLGDGLKFEQMAITATDAQLIEQLKWSAETVASCYHVPAFMIGAAQPPANNNIQLMTMMYYIQALQRHIEAIEILLDEGLNFDGINEGTEFDLDTLLRMDTRTLIDSLGAATQRGIMSPNEARVKLDLMPVEGGDQPFLQEQNWPLKVLADRPTPIRSPTLPSPTGLTPDPTIDPADEGSEGSNSDAKGIAGHLLAKANRIKRASRSAS